MVARWVAIAILVGLAGAMIPVILVWLWSISKILVSTILLMVIIVSFIRLILEVNEKELEIKKLEEQLKRQKENDEE